VPNRKEKAKFKSRYMFKKELHALYLHMYLNLAMSGSLSMTPHIAKSSSGYVLYSMVAAGNAVPMANTHVSPSGRCTNGRDVTFAFSCTDAMISPHNAPELPQNLKAKRSINAGSNPPQCQMPSNSENVKAAARYKYIHVLWTREAACCALYL
jgi:hypothetical protein